MSKPFRLKPLLELSRNRLDEAASELGRLISREQEGAEKLQMLQDYRTEYEQRFMRSAADGISVEALRNYSVFMARIDEAIEAQRQVVQRSEHATARGRQSWIHQRNRAKAFDTLHARHQEEQRRSEHKREQRFADEHSATRFHRRHEH